MQSGALFGVIFEGACFAAATMLLAALGGLLVSLVIGGWPAIRKFGFGFLTSAEWNPVTEVYGALGPMVGTLITAALSLAMALPVAGGVAFFLVELCPAPLRRPIGTAVELLAGQVTIALRSDADTNLELWAGEKAGEVFQQVYGLPMVLQIRK